ncbi:hypothetical protein [Azospirillum sp. ST 5-10]|uniref:hypothetical protein n=1 Tax=unclassified Azospirillum TaxID=2630922 RepID=UPI003F4A1D2D
MHQIAPVLAPPPVMSDRAAGPRRAPGADLRTILLNQPEPQVESLRGVRLVLAWLAMLAASWLVAVVLGYGLFALLRALAE